MTMLPQPDLAARNRRYHALDALRAGAMLLGVVLHAAVAYLDRPMAGLVWAVDDASAGPWLDAVFWWIHAFRIPLFFVMAGFFSAMVVRSRGVSGFVMLRLRRVAVPLLVAAAVVLPVVYVIWSWGWVRAGRATWREVRHLEFRDPHIQQNFLGPAHLWFLEYLLIYCLIYAVLAWWRGAERAGEGEAGSPPRGRCSCPWLTSWYSPLVVALPTAAVLLAEPGVFVRFRNPILPDAWELVYHGWAFACGVWLWGQREGLARLGRTGPWHLALGVAAFAGWAWLTRGGGGGEHEPSVATRGGLTMLIALTCWGTAYGFTGLAMRWLDTDRPAVRFLSDSAYWIYLTHLPLVGLGQVLLMPSGLHPAGKFALTTAAAFALTLLTYRGVVRYTIVGRCLNGPRTRPEPSGPTGLTPHTLKP